MAVLWMICIESDYQSETFVICSNLLFTGALVAPLTLIKPRNLLVQAVILLIGVIFYVLLPYSIETSTYAERV
jgi:predicted membrane channel-forming protein YqfA (hemolysin III family)